VDALSGALASLIDGPVKRQSEGQLYERILQDAYANPDRILAAAGTWEADRVDTM
jgi:asparagine synthase (glutamine-hydrolysing)